MWVPHEIQGRIENVYVADDGYEYKAPFMVCSTWREREKEDKERGCKRENRDTQTERETECREGIERERGRKKEADTEREGRGGRGGKKWRGEESKEIRHKAVGADQKPMAMYILHS